ncbi:MAG: hypothetical protein PHC65_02150 [Methanobacteriaceae archaeon]|jgi:hypothetical protein|uniref:hypothetical protein n=1 Tax=Methanobrevibacter TaxID=2172 RepID=UPI002A1068C2|nr:hypothetical protein [Methanobacteriaceae archaeon]MDD3408424.1 hypothetical protein [Methanobacteriaceae archaeon]MDD4593498.1 hypothetical protein [Methanobacteriaceae archaeon]
MFYKTIMRIDDVHRLRDIRDQLLVLQGRNPTREGDRALKVVVQRIDNIQEKLDKR